MVGASQEIAAAAARMIVEEGMEYGAAKRRAVRDLGVSGRACLPGNDEIEAEVRAYITLFCADSQPGELQQLRLLALEWMERMARFRPHLSGAVWHGTATRLSDVYLQLFCDDSKTAEIALIDHDVRFDPRVVKGFKGDDVTCLSVHAPCPALSCHVGIHLLIYDHDDLRGALRPDSQRRSPRGDAAALRKRMQTEQEAMP